MSPQGRPKGEHRSAQHEGTPVSSATITDRQRVVITGVGVVSPFGAGVPRFWQALLAGASAMRPVAGFDGTRYRSAQGGEVPAEVYGDAAARQRCGAPLEDGTYFLALAAEEALGAAGLRLPLVDPADAGAVLGTLCAGMRALQVLCGRCDADMPADMDVQAATASYQLNFLCERYGLGGPSSLVSTACSSTTDALGYAFDLVRSGRCSVCLTGGGDVLAESIHSAFNGLQSITTTQARPFDRGRDGFFIGEGAAVLVLESLDHARQRGAPVLAEVLGYGLSNTAHHLTATSEDGAGEALAVERALQDAGLAPGQVDYLNCHGTGTRHNDASEVGAINRVFGEAAPRVRLVSNKSSFGHCMGAAGALEAVSTVLSLAHQCIPPTLNTRADEPALRSTVVVDAPQSLPIRHALTQSFGFGGACSCVALGRYDG